MDEEKTKFIRKLIMFNLLYFELTQLKLEKDGGTALENLPTGEVVITATIPSYIAQVISANTLDNIKLMNEIYSDIIVHGARLIANQIFPNAEEIIKFGSQIVGFPIQLPDIGEKQ